MNPRYQQYIDDWNRLKSPHYSLCLEYMPHQDLHRVFLKVHGTPELYVTYEAQHYQVMTVSGHRIANLYEHDIDGHREYQFAVRESPERVFQISDRAIPDLIDPITRVSIRREMFEALRRMNDMISRDYRRPHERFPRETPWHDRQEVWDAPTRYPHAMASEGQKSSAEQLEIVKKSEKALRDVIGDDKFQIWKQTQKIEFDGNSGTYTLKGNECFLKVFVKIGPKTIETTYPICIQPDVTNMPLCDTLASKYLMLQKDENYFLTTGFFRDSVHIPDEYQNRNNERAPAGLLRRVAERIGL